MTTQQTISRYRDKYCITIFDKFDKLSIYKSLKRKYSTILIRSKNVKKKKKNIGKKISTELREGVKIERIHSLRPKGGERSEKKKKRKGKKRSQRLVDGVSIANI